MFFYSFPFLQVQTCFLVGSHSNRHFEHFLFLIVLILLSQFLFLCSVWGLRCLVLRIQICVFFSFPFLQIQTCFLLGGHCNRHLEHFLFLIVLILLSQFLFLRAVWGFCWLCWEFKRAILVQTCFLLRRPGIIIIILSQFLFHYAVWGFHCLVFVRVLF